jgi:hypothetical protein
LAVGLIPGAKAEPFGVRADIAFGEVANGQQQHGELIFAQIAKHVTLVLLIIGPANEKVLAGSRDDLGVVTRRYGVKAEAHGPLEQQVELDVTVALNAGIGRLAGEVTFDKRRDNVALELFGVVEDVMVDPEGLGHSSRIFDVGDRTAT